MGKRETLIRKICARPPEAKFSDVRQLLEMEGYRLGRASGSHNAFVKTGCDPIIVPTKHGRSVSRTYLDHICEILDLDEES